MQEREIIDRTLAALSDPTRRRVVDLLRAEPRRAGELAEALQMTPAALSRHLRVLRQGGVIVDEDLADDARVKLYRLQPQAFASLRDWLDEVEAYWDEQLQAFKQHAEALAKAHPGRRPAKGGEGGKPAVKPKGKRT